MIPASRREAQMDIRRCASSLWAGQGRGGRLRKPEFPGTAVKLLLFLLEPYTHMFVFKVGFLVDDAFLSSKY